MLPYHTPEKVGTLAALAAPWYFSAPGGEKEFEDCAKKEHTKTRTEKNKEKKSWGKELSRGALCLSLRERSSRVSLKNFRLTQQTPPSQGPLLLKNSFGAAYSRRRMYEEIRSSRADPRDQVEDG